MKKLNKNTIIIMASGLSKRMGKDKRFLKYRGKTFIDHIFSNLTDFRESHEIICVTENKIIIKKARKKNFRVVYNPNRENGQSESIKLGVKNRKEKGNITFLAVDLIFVKKEIIEKLEKNLKNNKVIRPIYKTKKDWKYSQHIFFPRKYEKALTKLKNGETGRSVIQKKDVKIIPIYNSKAYLDVDTKKMYRLLKR